MKQDLGKLLLENGQITSSELAQATQEAQQSGEPVGRVLLRLGLVNEDNIKTVLELHYAVNYLNLGKVNPIPNLIGLLPRELVLQHELVLVNKEDNRLTLAMVNPSDSEGLAKAKLLLTSMHIRIVVCSDDSFQDFIARLILKEPAFMAENQPTKAPTTSPTSAEIPATSPTSIAAPPTISPKSIDITESGSISSEGEPENTSPQNMAIARLCNHILSNAITRGCTNIHIEPAERQILVHYRKEGVLFAARKLPKTILPELITRFKNMSSTGGTEQALPYDGRLNILHAGQNFFFRLSIIPGTYGEHLVIWLE